MLEQRFAHMRDFGSISGNVHFWSILPSVIHDIQYFTIFLSYLGVLSARGLSVETNVKSRFSVMDGCVKIDISHVNGPLLQANDPKIKQNRVLTHVSCRHDS